MEGVRSTVLHLLADPPEPLVLKAYLIIATAYMRRNLFVHSGCLLEVGHSLLWVGLSVSHPGAAGDAFAFHMVQGYV